jgi:hypothetical protein
VELWSSPGGDTYQGDLYLPTGLTKRTVENAIKEGAERWIGYRHKLGFDIVSGIDAQLAPTLDPQHEGEDHYILRAKFRRFRPRLISLDGYRASLDQQRKYGVTPTVGVVNEAYGKPLPSEGEDNGERNSKDTENT